MTTPTPGRGGKRVNVPLWAVIAVPIFALLLVVLAVVVTLMTAKPSNSSRTANTQSSTTRSTSTSQTQASTATTTTSFSPYASVITPTTVTSTAPPQDLFPEWTGDNAEKFSTEAVRQTLDAAVIIDSRVQPANPKVRMTAWDKEYHCGTRPLSGSSTDAPTIVWCQDDGRFYVQYAAMTSRLGSNRDGAITDVLQAVGQHLLNLRGNPKGNSACAAGALAIKLVDTGQLSIEKARNLAAYATDRTNYTVGLDGINKC